MERTIPNEPFFAEVERLVGEGRDVCIAVRGSSMRPLLCDGRDSVVLAPFADGELTAGAVVLFRHGGRHLLHRIVKRTGQNLELQGDASPVVEKAAAADVAAIVREIIKDNGRIVRNGSPEWRRDFRRVRFRRWMQKLMSRAKRAVIRGRAGRRW